MDRETYNSIRKRVEEIEKRLNGGAGSGNFGHAGRPGKIGGSAPEGSGGSTKKSEYTKADQIKDSYKAGQITEAEKDELLAKAKADGTDKDKVEKPKKKTQRKTQSQKADEDIYEWGKKNLSFPEDMRHNEKASFDQMLARMYDGDDFYEEFGDIDSVDREKVFDEMAKRTGLDYDDIYNTWLNGHEIDLDSSNKNYEGAVQSKRNVERYLQSLTNSPRLRELNEKGYFKLSKKERDEQNLRDMVSSVWTYGGGKDSEYLQKSTSPHSSREQYANLTEKERKKIVDEEWDYLDKNAESSPAGTDSEGVSYRSLSFKRR